MSGKQSVRSEMLSEADGLVNGDRNAQYGEPHQDFQRTADMIGAMGFTAPGGKPVEAHHVALLLACVKLSRLVWSPEKRDSWVDLAGYAACGLEAYELTRPEPAPVQEPVMPDGWEFRAHELLGKRYRGLSPSGRHATSLRHGGLFAPYRVSVQDESGAGSGMTL